VAPSGSRKNWRSRFFELTGQNGSFAWLATPSALTMLSVAALAEILAYYVPAVDNLLDTLATPAALVAATIVFGRSVRDFRIVEED
jgi:Domain of unknown function (DUF4126)